MADKMELYHIHKHNNYDKLWKPYREITVNENFKSIMSKRYNDFTTSMIIEEDQNKILLNFHDYLLTLLSSKTQINRQEFQKILQIAYQTSYFSIFSTVVSTLLASMPTILFNSSTVLLKDILDKHL